MFCGATWPLRTGMFTRRKYPRDPPPLQREAPFTSKSRSYRCWLDVLLLLLLLPPPQTIATDERSSLFPHFKWPSPLRTEKQHFSSPSVCPSVWTPPRRNARNRGGSLELHAVRKAFRVEGMGAILTSSVVLRLGRVQADGRWLMCQREWRCSQGA